MRLRQIFFALTLLASSIFVQPAHASTNVENPLFGYTHLLPSPFTIPAGRLVYGTEFAYGVTDFFQVGTNALLDFFRIFNVSGKLSMLDFKYFAMGLNFTGLNYNYQSVASTNPDTTVSAFLPGLTTAFGIGDALALFVGGNLNYSIPKPNASIATSGWIRGATLESDLSWAYKESMGGGGSGGEGEEGSEKVREPAAAKHHGIGNVLSGGISYDTSYKLFGIGISHHWPGFHLGLHYYPSATKNQILPILAGGGSLEF